MKALGVSILIILLLACITGYVKNVIGLVGCDFEAPYKCEVIRTIGIIPPVGAIAGWIDLGE